MQLGSELLGELDTSGVDAAAAEDTQGAESAKNGGLTLGGYGSKATE